MRLEAPEVSNVYVFVSDALRYDTFLSEWNEDGELLKTASCSPISCTAFTSIVTGLHAPQHGVWRFSDRIDPELPTLYDLGTGRSPNFRLVSSVVDSFDRLTNTNDPEAFKESVRALEPPFCVIDRELSTHAAYGFYGRGSYISDEERQFQTTSDYWADRAGNREQIRADYREGARQALERFRDRTAALEEAGLLDDTLVVVTGDHGEVLGEEGLYGHAPTLVPESVYVPTFFWDGGASVRVEDADDSALISHVDYLPTFAAATGNEVPDELPGYDLTTETPIERPAFVAKRNGSWKMWGAFDADGGHTFSDHGPLGRLASALNLLFRVDAAPANRSGALTSLRTALRHERSFGDPEFDRETAASICQEILDDEREARSATLDEDAKERLRALGYADEEI